jgi:hypothetical protein
MKSRHKFELGDMVKFKLGDFGAAPPSDVRNLLGIIVGTGTRESWVYGDGIEIHEYVEVKWLNSRYSQTAIYTSPTVTLEIVSKKT